MNGEKLRRLGSNALVLAAAAFGGVLLESAGQQLDLALLVAGGTAAVWAIIGVAAHLTGFVTPGNPVVVNAVLAGLGTGAGALVAGGVFTEAALVAAGGAAIRAATGILLGVSDHPKPLGF